MSATGPSQQAIQARPGWQTAKAQLEKKAREEAEALRKRWAEKTERDIMEGRLEPKSDQQSEEAPPQSDGSNEPVTRAINVEAFKRG